MSAGATSPHEHDAPEKKAHAPYIHGHWKTWQASQDGRSLLHLIYNTNHTCQIVLEGSRG